MKIKALIITALLVTASVASTMAQVYSANAVGYVNVPVPALGKTILANPLNNGDNHADTIMPLGDAASGAIISRFDAVAQNYKDVITYVDTTFGWVNPNTFDKTPPELFILVPGEAFFFENVQPTGLTITFVGDVPQGDLSTPLRGSDVAVSRNLVSSQVPQEAPLDLLAFPAAQGDIVFLWDNDTQNFTPDGGVSYVGEGLGWRDAGFNEVPPPDDPVWGAEAGKGPVIPVGRGFFVQKVGAESQSWDRTFSVN